MDIEGVIEQFADEMNKRYKYQSQSHILLFFSDDEFVETLREFADRLVDEIANEPSTEPPTLLSLQEMDERYKRYYR